MQEKKQMQEKALKNGPNAGKRKEKKAGKKKFF